MPGSKRRRIFISHAGKDKALTDEILQLVKLRCPDAAPFYTSHEAYGLQGGQDLRAEHIEGIGEAVASILVITPAAADSNWCVQEWAMCAAAGRASGSCFPVLAPKDFPMPAGYHEGLTFKRLDSPGLDSLLEWLLQYSDEPNTNIAELNPAKDRVLRAAEQLAAVSRTDPLLGELREEVRELQPALEGVLRDTVKEAFSGLTPGITSVVENTFKAFSLDAALKTFTALGARSPIVLAGANVGDRLGPLLKSIMVLEEERQSALLEDYSTIYGLLWRLAEILPHGSAWLGISHLVSTEAWRTGHPGLVQFEEKLEKRCGAEELSVCRIYVRPDLESDKVLDVLEAQREKGIDVRTVDNEYPDISLLWTPPAGKTRPANGKATLVARLGKQRWKLSAGLEFTSRNNDSLDKVAVYTEGHEDLARLRMCFESAWRNSRPLS